MLNTLTISVLACSCSDLNNRVNGVCTVCLLILGMGLFEDLCICSEFLFFLFEDFLVFCLLHGELAEHLISGTLQQFVILGLCEPFAFVFSQVDMLREESLLGRH